MVASYMVSLLQFGKGGGFVYGILIGVGEGWWLREWYFYWSWGGWWLCLWYLYWGWGRVVASCMVSLLELGTGGGFVYRIFIEVGERWWLRIWYLNWNWGIVVASFMVSLLEVGKGGGFVYGIFIGIGE